MALRTIKPRKNQISKTPMGLQELYAIPGYLTRRSYQISVALFFDEFTGHEVTPVQYAALIAINDQPGVDQRGLVRLIAVDRSTIGNLLRVLEDKGLVIRVTPKSNQRVKQTFVTKKGVAVLANTREEFERTQRRFLAPLGVKSGKVFMDLLTKLVNANNHFSRAPLKNTFGAPSTRATKPFSRNKIVV